MRFAPFALDRWLNAFPDITHDLASSTGPGSTLGELLDALDDGERARLRALPSGYGHPEGNAELREQIAGLYGADPDHVQVTTGAQEAFLVLFADAAEAGRNVVVPDPAFSPLQEIPRALGLEVRTYRLHEERGWAIDLDEVAALVDDHTALLLVNSPHNPSGAVLSPGELHALGGLAQHHGARLVSDEVYHPLYLPGVEGVSAAGIPGAVVVGDLSKAMCAAALRIGWLLEPDAERRARYFDLRAYFTIANATGPEVVGASLLRRRRSVLARAQRNVAANAAFFARFVAEHASRLSWVPLRGGTVAFPRLLPAEGTLDVDARPLCEELARRGVLVVPGDCFGWPSHLRIGFGAEPATFREGIARLGELLVERPQPMPSLAQR